MRIRSIKPEYWSHRMHEVISETASLLALGLLNYADDEGRFLANPRTIECTLFPVRAPKKSVAACLQELEQVGFITRYTANMDGREVTLGFIQSFTRHQVINKAYHSRLAPPPITDYSGNATVVIPESSVIAPESLPSDYCDGKEKDKDRIRIGTESPISPFPASTPSPTVRQSKAPRAPLSPASQPEPIGSRMLAINELVGRRASTCWAPAELAALHAAGLAACTDDDFTEQLTPLLRFYRCPNVPDPKDRNDPLHFRRRDLGTLLNHWAGEIDKANAWRTTLAATAYAQPSEGLTGAN